MMTYKNVLAIVAIGACFSMQSFASESDQLVDSDQLEAQTLELEAVDVTELQLSAVQDEATENASEIHQESTLGRAGLAGACM